MRTATCAALDSVPALVHGFERRLGPPGWETRDAARARVGQALEAFGRLFFLKQVHGSTIVTAPFPSTPEADGAVAEHEGLILAVETADCLPIFIVDPLRKAVAAVHAGWRGTAKGIAKEAVKRLLEGGSRAEDLRAALGPSIGTCCYEVGDEVRAAFPDTRCFRPGRAGRYFLDLRGANRYALEELGLRDIHEIPECTQCQTDSYHSYRREGKGSGRMVNFVGFRATRASTP